MNKLLEFTLYTELQAIPKDKIKLQLRLRNLVVPLVFIQTQVRERDIYQGTYSGDISSKTNTWPIFNTEC